MFLNPHVFYSIQCWILTKMLCLKVKAAVNSECIISLYKRKAKSASLYYCVEKLMMLMIVDHFRIHGYPGLFFQAGGWIALFYKALQGGTTDWLTDWLIFCLLQGREEFLHFVPALYPPYKVFSTKGVTVSW